MIAGEIGQTSIDYQGKDFVYGNKVALEAYVGIWHIAERAKEIYSSAGKTLSDEDALRINCPQPQTRTIHWRWNFGPTSVSSLWSGYPMWFGC